MIPFHGRLHSFLIDSFSNWVTLSIVDSFMNGIDIPLQIELIFAALLSLCEMALE
jgi:hypothetical protein